MRRLSKASNVGILSLAAAVGALPCARALAQTNIIQNGGFETTGGTNAGGVVANWNVFEGPDSGPLPAETEQITVDTTMPHSGSNDLLLTNNNPSGYGLYMYQDTPAGSVTPGAVYTLSFYAAGTTGVAATGLYNVLFFTSSGTPIANSGTVNPQNFFPNSSTYTQYPTATASFTAPAGANYAEVAFNANTGAVPNSSIQYYLDDVSLTTAGSSGGGGTGASVWNNAGAGDWNVAGNWTAGVPNGIDAEADMFGALTANHTVYTDTAITLGTLNFNNTNTYVVSGAGSLTMQASSGSATIIVQQGTQKVNLPLTIASNTSLNVSSGATLLISNPVTINAGDSLSSVGSGTVKYQSNITVNSGGSLALASSTFANSLALLGTATASVSSAGSRLLVQLNSLSLGTGTLNLGNNDLIVHGGSIGTITSALQAGYAGGAWNGGGIQSTTAAADSTHLTALGSMTVSAAGTYDGATIAPGDVVVRYTYYGDATLDGTVNSADYARIDAGFLGHLTGWQNGDFNYDNVINGSDYTLIDNAFNTQGTPIGSASAQFASATAQIGGVATAVPEPASLAMLGLGVSALLTRRRNQQG